MLMIDLGLEIGGWRLEISWGKRAGPNIFNIEKMVNKNAIR